MVGGTTQRNRYIADWANHLTIKFESDPLHTSKISKELKTNLSIGCSIYFIEYIFI